MKDKKENTKENRPPVFVRKSIKKRDKHLVIKIVTRKGRKMIGFEN